MGLNISKIKERNGVNHDCPVCKNTKKVPNLVGRFILINEYQYKCSGCDSLFNKNTIFSFHTDNRPIILDNVIKV
jgi:hypothetical protein